MPALTEEEYQRTEAYQRDLRMKRQRKLVITGVAMLAAAGLGYLITTLAINGVDDTKDKLLGNPARELLEGQWYTSDYGVPPMTLETPEILQRVSRDSVAVLDTDGMMAQTGTFQTGSLSDPMYVRLKNSLFKPEVRYAKSDSTDYVQANLAQELEAAYALLETLGAKNILMKDEPWDGASKLEGMRFYGTTQFTGSDQEKQYEIFITARAGGFQQLLLVYDDETTEEESRRFLNQARERIVGSIKFPVPAPDKPDSP